MKHKGESGAVAVEAAIVVTIVVIFISVFLYIGMILYQQSLVSIMANQTASNIAQVYSNSIKDPFTGYVDSDSVYQSVTYSSMKTDAYVDVLTQKANTLADYRLKSSRILTTGNQNVDVSIVKKPNELLKSQIVVTIRDKYQLPLVSFFGMDNKLEFSASGRADCVDILEYINGVNAIGDPERSNVTALPDMDTCLIRFFDSKTDNNLVASVPVLKGKSIITSNYYTHSVMPVTPTSGKYDFAGWKTDDGTGFFATTEVSGNINVYGAWKCTVTFEPEGGSVAPDSKSTELGSSTEFPKPERAGWTFLGWFTEKEGAGTQYYSNITVITDNIVLYADWQCNHDYELISSTEATCIKKSVMKYKCRQCGDEKTEEGVYGNHRFGEAIPISEATCCQRSRFKKVCSVCSLEKEFEGDFGEHSYNGRCGVTHNVSVTLSSHNTSNGYTKTTKAQCIVCKYCGNPYKDKGWTKKYGAKTAWGIYCWAHNDNSGENRPDKGGSAHFDKYPIYKVH